MQGASQGWGAEPSSVSRVLSRPAGCAALACAAAMPVLLVGSMGHRAPSALEGEVEIRGDDRRSHARSLSTKSEMLSTSSQLKRGCLGLRYPADVVFSPSCCSAHAPQAPGVLFRKGAGVEYCLFDAVADDQDLFSLWLGARIPIQAVPQ